MTKSIDELKAELEKLTNYCVPESAIENYIRKAQIVELEEVIKYTERQILRENNQIKQEQTAEKMAFELLPEPLRAYAHLEYHNKRLTIKIGNSAMITRAVQYSEKHIDGSWEIESVRFIDNNSEDYGCFKILKYVVSKINEDIYMGWESPYPRTKDIQKAVAMAVDMGDCKEEAEAELAEFKAKQQVEKATSEQKNKVSIEVKSNTDFCPFVDGRCEEDSCAIWNTVHKSCSILVLSSLVPNVM